MNKKHILVTGASSGLGKEIAKRLSEDGYKVFAGVRKEEDKQALESLSPNIIGVFLDVTNDESVNSAFEKISATTDELYALVNNAGIAVAGPVEYLPVDLLKNQFEVNLYGALRTTQRFLPMMSNSPSRIVNISSMSSYGIFPFVSPYCVSKKALDMLFNSLLIEAKLPNLKVISIKPGVIKTPIWNRALDECEKNYEFLCEEGKKKYSKEFEVLAQNARKNTNKGLDPKDVASLVSKVLSIKNPKLSYNIGTDSIVAGLFSKLPQGLTNFLIKKALASKIN